ncbi:MAG: hemolysin family protein [Anaerolineae bacterium]
MLVILTVIVALLLINALYVAAEFATLSSRRARLAQMAEEGNPLAGLMLPIVGDPRRLDTYIAACQLGITLSSLVLGFYAQAELSPIMAPWLEQLGISSGAAALSLAATVVLVTLTGFQVIIGELVPKNIAVQYPERLAMVTAAPMRWSLLIFRPLIWLFNGSSQLLLRLFGIEAVRDHVHIHTAEEIAILVEESGAGGVLDQQEQRLIENTLWMSHASVRQIMAPRTRVLAAPVDAPLRAALQPAGQLHLLAPAALCWQHRQCGGRGASEGSALSARPDSAGDCRRAPGDDARAVYPRIDAGRRSLCVASAPAQPRRGRIG